MQLFVIYIRDERLRVNWVGKVAEKQLQLFSWGANLHLQWHFLSPTHSLPFRFLSCNYFIFWFHLCCFTILLLWLVLPIVQIYHTRMFSISCNPICFTSPVPSFHIPICKKSLMSVSHLLGTTSLLGNG